MEQLVIGIPALKDKYRQAKLMCGDLRGLKNRFSLSEKLNVPALQTYYFSCGGHGDTRAELVADCYGDEGGLIYEYTMSGLVEALKGDSESYEINLICLTWNKARSDAERKTVMTFKYKNK